MKNRNHLSPLAQDVLYGLEMELFDDDVGQALLRVYRAGVVDERTGGMIGQRAQRERFRQAFNHAPPFRAAKLHHGELILGSDMEGNLLRVPIQYLNAHSLTVANTGSGKTNKSRFYILQIAPHVRGMWLFDLRKREFRALRPLLTRLGIDLVVVPGRSLRINPLQVPVGVQTADWVPRAADMLVQVLGLPPRAGMLVQTALHGLYRRFEGNNGKRQHYPTLFDLHETVKSDARANPQARQAVVDRLKTVLWSLGPEVLAYRHGWPSQELAQMHLAFELAGLAETDKNLFLQWLVMSEFTSRIARGVSNPQMDLWICCDEAQRLCSASRAAAGQGSAITDQIGLVRGTGIGLDLSLLSTSDLVPQVVSNTTTKTMGRCGSAADYGAAGHSMGLDSEQIQWAQLHLKPGLFIGQVGEGDWRYPFLFKVPKLNMPAAQAHHRPVDDMGQLADLPTVRAEEFRDWGHGPSRAECPSGYRDSAAFASEREYRFFKAVLEHPLQASSRYPKLAGISSKTAQSIRCRLVSIGYIRERTVDSGRRGRSTILLEALSAGIEAASRYESRLE